MAKDSGKTKDSKGEKEDAKKVVKKVAKKKVATTKKSAVKKDSAGKSAKKTVTKKKVTKKKAAAKATSPVGVTMEERWRMIATAAYYKAEQRGFAPGDEFKDWLDAEAEIDALLSRK